MAKVQIGKWEIDEEELECQHQEAERWGAERARNEPQARSVSYDRPANRLIVELKNGIVFLLPCALVQGLTQATPEEITQVRMGPRGASLHWEKLDVDFSLAGLMAGDFGTRAWMEELRQPPAPMHRVDPLRRRRPVTYGEPSGSAVVIREDREE